MSLVDTKPMSGSVYQDANEYNDVENYSEYACACCPACRGDYDDDYVSSTETIAYQNDLAAADRQTRRMHHKTNLIHKRNGALRKIGPHLGDLNVLNPPELEVAPKWRRHAEEYINPHLLPHERDPIAPRYGVDLPAQKVMPRYQPCRCSWCKSLTGGSKAGQREIEKGLKTLVKPARQGAQVGPAGQKRGPWADWDWDGQGSKESRARSQTISELISDLSPSAKPAPQSVTVDLMAMAKPAKTRGKRKLVPTRDQTRAQTPSLHAGSSMAGFSEIDGFSALDYEENWEHLDIDRLTTEISRLEMERGGDALTDGTRSEWDWERFSQI